MCNPSRSLPLSRVGVGEGDAKGSCGKGLFFDLTNLCKNLIKFSGYLCSISSSRVARDIFMRGVKGNIRSIYNAEYKLTLYDLLKSYSSIVMKKDFHRINIPKLPVFTTEDGIKRIKEFFGKLTDWKNIDELIPKNFLKNFQNKKTGKAGIFAGSLELAKEGNLSIKQNKLFDKLYIKEIK